MSVVPHILASLLTRIEFSRPNVPSCFRMILHFSLDFNLKFDMKIIYLVPTLTETEQQRKGKSLISK